MVSATDNGIVNEPSNHSVEETVEKLKGILQAKGVTLFALVDHSGEAEKAGIKMHPTKLLIFGANGEQRKTESAHLRLLSETRTFLSRFERKFNGAAARYGTKYA